MVSSETKRAWASHLGVAADMVDPNELREQLREGSLPLAFLDGAQKNLSAKVQIGKECISHEELHEFAARTATVLAEEGVSRGSRVIICAKTSLQFLTAYLGALWAGATVVLANPNYTQNELEKLVKESGPQLLVTEELTGDGVTALWLSDLVVRSREAAAADPAPLEPDDIALLAFTSGTTGSPKGVPLSHGNLLASIRAVVLAWRWTESDTLIHSLPLFHQHGLSGVHASLMCGSNLIVLDHFDPEDLVRTAEQESATILFAVPSIHQRLIDLDRELLDVLGRFRVVTSGSAPLSPALEATFHERTGTRLLQRYGLTETGLDVSNPYDGERVVGSVGFSLPGIEVALLSQSGGPVAGPNDEGEICFRGPQVFDGYLDNPEATASAFWTGGWFRTGDLGVWDADRLRITGRLKDLIITGGMNVSPQEVERVIEQLAGVLEVGVSGMPSERWGEEVTAWIVLNHEMSMASRATSEADAEAVIALCRQELATYKCPKKVFVIDELPRNALGKIVRSQLPKATPL